jgi:hypothetical protein
MKHDTAKREILRALITGDADGAKAMAKELKKPDNGFWIIKTGEAYEVAGRTFDAAGLDTFLTAQREQFRVSTITVI